jgi:pSer/pThr/pTyr-binding forkhead associated (FHA) protein
VGKGVTAADEKHAELHLGLNEKDEFNSGRSIDADCLICDVNISRKHAHLKFDKEIDIWTITDNKSANGVMLNDIRLTPLHPFGLKHGDRISIPSIKHTYVWIYQTGEKNLEVGAVRPGKDRAENINHQIDESQQFQLEQVLKEKEELDSKVKIGELIRENLAKEKDQLAQTLINDRARFIENQEKERKDFEQKLSANREETIENQRNEFEKKLANEREILEMNHKKAEETLAEKCKEAEDKVSEALNERNIMVGKMEEEKLKAEKVLEDEKRKYEKQVADLEKKAIETMKKFTEKRLNVKQK